MATHADIGSRDRRYDSARWKRLRVAVIARDGGRCTHPGCTVDVSGPRMLHADHVAEVRDGADFWDPTNLATLCRTHHTAKTLAVAAGRVTAEPSSEDW